MANTRARVGARFSGGSIVQVTEGDWQRFEQWLDELRKCAGSRLLFRGQGNSRWRLETTLERVGTRPCPWPRITGLSLY